MDVTPLADRYYADAAVAYARTRLGAGPCGPAEDLLPAADAAGLDLHHFKRTSPLPRVQRLLGALRGMAPASLVDVGIGRGAFLWPLLDALPDLRVLAVDHDPLERYADRAPPTRCSSSRSDRPGSSRSERRPSAISAAAARR